MVAFYGFHVAKYPIVSYGNPMIKSGSVNAVKLFEVALGCLAVLGSSKMTNLHWFWGSGFFGGKKNIFWGLSKTENHFWVFQKQEKKLQVAPKDPRIYKTTTDLLEIATHRECRFAAHNSFFVALPNVDVSPGNPRFIEREAPPEAVQGDTVTNKDP